MTAVERNYVERAAEMPLPSTTSAFYVEPQLWPPELLARLLSSLPDAGDKGRGLACFGMTCKAWNKAARPLVPKIREGLVAAAYANAAAVQAAAKGVIKEIGTPAAREGLKGMAAWECPSGNVLQVLARSCRRVGGAPRRHHFGIEISPLRAHLPFPFSLPPPFKLLAALQLMWLAGEEEEEGGGGSPPPALAADAPLALPRLASQGWRNAVWADAKPLLGAFDLPGRLENASRSLLKDGECPCFCLLLPISL